MSPPSVDLSAVKSIAIQSVVRAAVESGNEVAEITEGWSKVKQVVQMRRPMAPQVLHASKLVGELRHWKSDATPHNPAEEGFVDDTQCVAVAFPR
jgi:hypothetical protein